VNESAGEGECMTPNAGAGDVTAGGWCETEGVEWIERRPDGIALLVCSEES
jgi:hypothetical protein